jgi:hypothetical protein
MSITVAVKRSGTVRSATGAQLDSGVPCRKRLTPYIGRVY